MEYIYITLTLPNGKSFDMKVPRNITAYDLLVMLEEAFGINDISRHVLHIEPLGRILGKDELLEQEGIYSGSQITIV